MIEGYLLPRQSRKNQTASMNSQLMSSTLGGSNSSAAGLRERSAADRARTELETERYQLKATSCGDQSIAHREVGKCHLVSEETRRCPQKMRWIYVTC